MSLGWMFYLADISAKVSGLLFVVSFLLVVILFCLIFAAIDGTKISKLLLFGTPCCLFFTLLIGLLLPSKTTIYAFGAQYAIEDIATMPETKQVRETLTKFLEVVDSKLDEELEDEAN